MIFGGTGSDVIQRIADDLLDRDDVWWAPLIAPGAWETSSGAHAVDFLARWINMDREAGRPPFALVHPPLQIKRLRLAFAPITLWQVATDVLFDVGIVDMIEFTQAPPGTDETPAGDGRDTAAGQRPRQAPRLAYLVDQVPFSVRVRDGVIETARPLSPSKVLDRLACPVRTDWSEATATQFASILLSLSRRAQGRFAVWDPACPAAFIPAGDRDWRHFDMSDLIPPVATCQDAAWSVDCTGWMGDGLWRIKVRIEPGSPDVISAERLGFPQARRAESVLGPVRLYGYAPPSGARVKRVN